VQQSRRDRETSSIGDPANILRDFRSVSVTVKNSKQADDSHRRGRLRFDIERTDCAEHRNRKRYTRLYKGTPTPAMPSAPAAAMTMMNVIGTSRSARPPSCHAKTPTISIARM
jgi:hypothetical protein